MSTKTNIRLIRDSQTELGWYTRHDEHGYYDYLDDPIGDLKTDMRTALTLACQRFDVDESEIEVIGDV